VLLKEMQSLALDVNVLSDEGEKVEVREEDDELLRAAEELGIDLSPGSLRAAARQPTAEEVEEGQERTDESGELTVPADEAINDLADVEVTPSENAKEEAEAQAGPLADELADVEVDE
jgi:DNA-directed RNA polymerase subunit beta